MIIYKTTNLLNGKIYVGKDCCHESGYLGSGVILQRAVKKYGRENFKKEVLEVCDASNIDEREVYWIAKLNSRDQRIGYNIAVSGRKGNLGLHLSVETNWDKNKEARCRAISEARRRKAA